MFEEGEMTGELWAIYCGWRMKCEAKYGRRWNRGVGGTRLTGLCVSYVRICNLQSAKPFLREQASQRVSNRRVIWSKLFHRVTLETGWRSQPPPKPHKTDKLKTL